jgi:hypothetical protein
MKSQSADIGHSENGGRLTGRAELPGRSRDVGPAVDPLRRVGGVSEFPV